MHIKHLRLRVGTGSAQAGETFAREFTEALAAGSEGLAAAHIGTLRLRLRGAEADGAAAAAQAVLSRLSRRQARPDRNA